MDFFDSKEVEWADMRVLVAGARLTKITGLKFGVKVEKEYSYGEGDEPHSIQKGTRTYSGEIKVKVGALDDMETAAIAAGGRDITDLEFDVQVSFRKSGIRPLKTFTLTGVQFSEFERGWDQGAKSMDVTLPIMYLRQKTG